MAEKPDQPADQPASSSSRPAELAAALLPRNLGVKVGMLIAFTVTVIGGFIVYVLFARGVFEQTQRMYLITDNAEGLSVGTDLTFAGFPIGRVRRIALRDDGKVRISVRVPVSEAKWLRETSVFVVEVPLVGSARLRAYSSNLQDPPLPDGAERPVLRGDTQQEIPRMVATLRAVLENIDQMTESGSSLQQSINNARTVTERMAGKYGVLGGVLGGEDHARKVIAAIDRANALLASLGGVSLKLKGMPSTFTSPAVGWRIVSTIPQAAVCGAANACATLLMRPQGMPASVSVAISDSASKDFSAAMIRASIASRLTTRS